MTDDILNKFIAGFKEGYFIRVGSKNMISLLVKMMKVDIVLNTGEVFLL